MHLTHGTGGKYFGVIMTQVELRQRVREQAAAKRKQVLKYRGVSYIKKTMQWDLEAA